MSKAKDTIILSDYEEQCSLNKLADTVPIISATSQNNGLIGFVNPISKKERTSGKAITVVKDGVYCATAFYQPFDFYANSHIFVLQVNKRVLDQFSAFFLCLLIRLERFRYSFGRALTKKDAMKTKIFLPIDENGEINWDYMKSIVKIFYEEVVCNFEKELKRISEH